MIRDSEVGEGGNVKMRIGMNSMNGMTGGLIFRGGKVGRQRMRICMKVVVMRLTAKAVPSLMGQGL